MVSLGEVQRPPLDGSSSEISTAQNTLHLGRDPALSWQSRHASTDAELLRLLTEALDDFDAPGGGGGGVRGSQAAGASASSSGVTSIRSTCLAQQRPACAQRGQGVGPADVAGVAWRRSHGGEQRPMARLDGAWLDESPSLHRHHVMVISNIHCKPHHSQTRRRRAAVAPSGVGDTFIRPSHRPCLRAVRGGRVAWLCASAMGSTRGSISGMRAGRGSSASGARGISGAVGRSTDRWRSVPTRRLGGAAASIQPQLNTRGLDGCGRVRRASGGGGAACVA